MNTQPCQSTLWAKPHALGSLYSARKPSNLCHARIGTIDPAVCTEAGFSLSTWV
jgi:hypothetical protein